MYLKKWYDMNEFTTLIGKSRRTIESKNKIHLTKNPNWFIRGNRKYEYHIDYTKMFLSESLYESLIYKLDNEYLINQLRNTIDCLVDKPDSLEAHLTQLNWGYFATIAYKNELIQKRCFSELSMLSDIIKENTKGTFRVFFTTESFTHRKGYHNHLVIKCDGLGQKELKALITKYLVPEARIEVVPYDRGKAGIFYISKDGLHGENWDLNGNKLKEEGDLLEQCKKLKIK